MRAFGCDIGNGFAFVSILNEKDLPIKAMPLKWSQLGMPTDVFVKNDGTIIVGSRIYRSSAKTGGVVRAIKRNLNNHIFIAGRAIDSLEAYACVAKKVLDESFKYMIERGNNPPHQVLLTHPVAFFDSPKTLNRIADAVSEIKAPDGERYRVCGILPEPVAVAFDYLGGCNKKTEEKCVAIYDLGYGTFDAALVSSVVKNGDRNWTVHDFASLGNIGGIDFDQELVNLIMQKIELQNATVSLNEVDEEIIVDEAVRAKHLLTYYDKADVSVRLTSGQTYEYVIERNEFEERIMSLVVATTSRFDNILREAVDRGLKLDCVVLSGGSSLIPLVKRKVKELVYQRFKGDVDVTEHNPVSAVSNGAARYAALLDRRVVERPAHVDDSLLGRMRRLYKPLSLSNEYVRNVHVTYTLEYSLGIVDRGMLIVCIYGGSSLPATSDTLDYIPDRPNICLVIASANSAGNHFAMIPIGQYHEVTRLYSQEAHVGEEYKLTVKVDCLRAVSATLIGKSGHVIRMG